MYVKKVLTTLVVLTLLVLTAGRLEWPYLLQVVEARTGEVVLEVPLHAGECFTLEYRHSVQLTPVRETFRVQDGRMVLVETEYGTLGVGLPYGAEGDFELEDGRCFRLSGLDRCFQQVFLWVSEIAAHRLEIRGKEFSLPALVGSDSLVELRLARALPRPE